MDSLLSVQDQMDQEISFPFPPRRIVSLVPSQTEFLLDIGANVVGRTKFCIHLKGQVHDIPVIGGTKKFQFEKIKSLNPDLIIGNKEENYKEGINQLKKDFPVWMSDIYTLDDSYQMMKDLGQVCDRAEEASKVISECTSALDQVKGTFSGRVVYLIWKNPWMAAGKTTFIDHLLQFLGYENVVVGDRYPELTNQDISRLDPDKILFSSEPYPFKKKHIQEAKDQWSGASCQLVDGELHSWYGSRLRNWANYS